MGLNEIHPQVLRELAEEVAKPLSIIFERPWQSSKDPTAWKRRSITPFSRREKEDPENYKPASLTSMPGKITDQILLKALLRHMGKKDELIGENQEWLHQRQVVPNKLSGLLSQSYSVSR